MFSLTNKLSLLLLQLSCLLLLTYAQNGTQSSPTVPPTDSPINKALDPLYSMTDGFLRAVFPGGLRVDTLRKLNLLLFFIQMGLH